MTTKKESDVSKKTKPARKKKAARNVVKVSTPASAIGKSECLRRAAKKMGLPCIDIRLSQPVHAADLEGMPFTSSKPAISKDPLTAKTPQALSAFPLTEILGWRDSCRSRLDARQARLNELHMQHEAIVREVEKIDRKQHHDLLWCQKLNRVISRKVFG
jgi:hypothetical protein